jgi:hypothetical protein
MFLTVSSSVRNSTVVEEDIACKMGLIANLITQITQHACELSGQNVAWVSQESAVVESLTGNLYSYTAKF